jgi:cytidylate kinase
MKSHDSIKELEELLRARLAEWRSNEGRSRYTRKPVITITREPGSGGDALAERLAFELGMDLYDWELVERIAKDQKVTAQIVSALEKNPPNVFADYLAELQPEYGLTSQAYVESLKRILLAIAVPGNALILGHGSNFFLAPERKLGLCFVAPLAFRIRNVVKEERVSEKAARTRISKLEEAHRKLVKKYLQREIRDPTQYHLVINTALVKPDTVVQLVRTMLPKEEKG